MRVGSPREIKTNEHRVGLTPAAAGEYVAHGHAVLIETGAGLGAGFTDADYVKAGATANPVLHAPPGVPWTAAKRNPAATDR